MSYEKVILLGSNHYFAEGSDIFCAAKAMKGMNMPKKGDEFVAYMVGGNARVNEMGGISMKPNEDGSYSKPLYIGKFDYMFNPMEYNDCGEN